MWYVLDRPMTVQLMRKLRGVLFDLEVVEKPRHINGFSFASEYKDAVRQILGIPPEATEHTTTTELSGIDLLEFRMNGELLVLEVPSDEDKLEPRESMTHLPKGGTRVVAYGGPLYSNYYYLLASRLTSKLAKALGDKGVEYSRVRKRKYGVGGFAFDVKDLNKVIQVLGLPENVKHRTSNLAPGMVVRLLEFES